MKTIGSVLKRLLLALGGSAAENYLNDITLVDRIAELAENGRIPPSVIQELTFPLPISKGGTGATTANLALQHLGITIPEGWTIEFSYNSGGFCLDFVIPAIDERYRLTWWSEGISYQALINGEWQTIWVK